MEIIILILLLIVAIELTFLVARNTNTNIYKEKKRQIFVDTSVLIDGRIVTIAKSGFVPGKLVIPRSVVGELQFLADQADPEKRSRARHGLDVIAELQSVSEVDVEIFVDNFQKKEGVDDRLLKLAKKYNGIVCTIDYNLNKVAQVENIQVLNINDLAMGLRMSYLPGEKLLLELTQKGQEPNQAIGHIADGTMVVVENAKNKIGKTVEVEFIRSLQTAAGKMMFAKLTDNSAVDLNGQNKSINGKKVKSVRSESRKNKSIVPNNNNQSKKSNSANEVNQDRLSNRNKNDKKNDSNNTKINLQANSSHTSRKKNSKRNSNKSDQIEQNIIDLSNRQ